MKDLVILGTGGLGRGIHQVVEDINQDQFTWNLLGFLDQDPAKHGTPVHQFPVLGGIEWLHHHPDVWLAIGVASPPVRRLICKELKKLGHHKFPTLIHPLAWVANRVQVGEGTVILAGTKIDTDSRVGRHVVLNMDCTLGHDVVVDDFVTIAPGSHLSGWVHIEEGCDIGTNTAFIQHTTVGAWSIVGAGAVVLSDLPQNVTAVGVPARIIKTRPAGWHLEVRPDSGLEPGISRRPQETGQC